MGAWDSGVLDSDAALDVIADAVGQALSDLRSVTLEPITERSAFLASGCVGVIAVLKPEWVDFSNGLGPHSNAVSDENTAIRKALARFRLPLLRRAPEWRPLFVELVDKANARLADYEQLLRRYRNGDDIPAPWASPDETILNAVPSAALQHSQSAAYAQYVLEQVIDANEAEPSLTTLAGLVGLAEQLTPWARVPPHRLRTWNELLSEAKGSGEVFHQELASSCLAALKGIKKRTTAQR